MPMYLEFEQIGLIRLIQSNAALLLPLSMVGMAGSLVKHYPKIKKKALINKVISLQLVTISVACIILGGAVLICREYIQDLFNANSPAYSDYILISMIVLSCQSYFQYLFSICRSELNILFPAVLNEIFLRLGSMTLIVLFGFGVISFESIILLLTGFYLLNTIILLGFIYFKYKFVFVFDFFEIEKEFLKSIAGFAGYSLALSIGVSIFSNVSFLMTSYYLGLEANGIFTTCFFIGVIIEVPKRAINQIIGPLISDYFASNDLKSVEKLYQGVSINMGIISILIAIGILTNLQDLFALIPKGNSLSQGAFVVLTVGLSKVVSMFFGPSGEILIYSNHKNTMLYLLLANAGMLVLLNSLLIPYLGLNGAALAVFISVCVDQLFRFFMIRIKLKLRLFGYQHLKLLIFSGFIALTFYYLDFAVSPVLKIILRSTLISIAFLLGVYTLRISEEYNNFVNLLLSKIPFRQS